MNERIKIDIRAAVEAGRNDALLSASLNQADSELANKTERLELTRLDLPFVLPLEGGGIKSHWHVDHDHGGSYSKAQKIGESYFDQVAKLAEIDEFQAHLAMHLPMNSGSHSNWGNSGWGIECGFSEAMAAAAIVGLRCIREGLSKPYDHRAAIGDHEDSEVTK